MALDGIINVNSFFTLGLFLGLGLTMSPDPPSPMSPFPVLPAPQLPRTYSVCFHVYSLTSFLFSNLIASALKQAIRIVDGNIENEARGLIVTIIRVNLIVLRVGILVSGVGSVLGCGFLMMALVSWIQIKLGVFCRKTFYTSAAISPLVTLVNMALVIYVGPVLYAFSC